ncbi:MAG: cupin domain-containing protein [Christensenellales bacterium]|jgi:transcriptional regulator with XRE-family HTH domain
MVGENKSIGEKLRDLRSMRELTLEEVANRCDLSKGYLSQLERDLASPSIATLTDILECLGSDLRTFFSDSRPDKVVFTPDDVFEKEDEAQGVKITWLVPNAQRNEMEPILIDIEPGASTVIDYPHEGEEFGYVLQGKITVCLGQYKYIARRGDSFYIYPHYVHFLQNSGKSLAKVLWVSSPPSF